MRASAVAITGEVVEPIAPAVTARTLTGAHQFAQECSHEVLRAAAA
jgi:hypothetical protein